MKKLGFTLFLFCAVFVLKAQVLVSYDRVDEVDLSLYKTFEFDSVNIDAFPEFQPRKEGIVNLLSAISREMTARGYERVKAGGDLIINLGVTITEEVQTRETDIRDAPRYMGTRNYHWESEEIVVREYEQGTITLDMVDAEEEEMIWQAVAAGALADKQVKNKKKIDKAVQKLFKKFPVDPKS